jgi:NADPH:quinone reductase-like Zn-dependent oxidoreductase
MKAFEVREFGIDRLELAERPEPEPGEGEVVVRMRAWSLNFRDLLLIRGEYNPKLKRPMVPLSDGAGEVVKTGAGVTRVKTGDRVFAAFMQKWIGGEPDEGALRSALGGAVDGVAAEYVVFDQAGLVPIPDYLSFEEAATLPCTGVTAWHALISEGHLRPEETVLVQGTGGVSIFALQFAKLMKSTVIVTSSKDEKLERARKMGADAVVNYAENPEWHKTVRDITSGRGVDQIIEVGGAGTLGKSMRAVRPGGIIHVIGVLSGRGDIDFTPVFMRNLRLQGIFVGSREMAEDMCVAMTAHELRPVIDRVFPFGAMREALHYMETGAHFGKIVVSAEQ